MLVPRYTAIALPTARRLAGIGSFGQPPPITNAGDLVIACLDRRGVPTNQRTPLATLLCAADEMRPLIAEMQTRTHLFAEWVAAFQIGTKTASGADTIERTHPKRAVAAAWFGPVFSTFFPVHETVETGEGSLREVRDAVVDSGRRQVQMATDLISAFTRALQAMDVRVAEYTKDQRELDAVYATLSDPADIAEFAEIQNTHSTLRRDFWVDVARPVLFLAVRFVNVLRKLSALSIEAIRADAQFMVSAHQLLNETIKELAEAERESPGILGRIARLIFGEDPMGTVIAGVAIVGLGMAAFFLLPPLFRGLAERVEARAKPKPKTTRKAKR